MMYILKYLLSFLLSENVKLFLLLKGKVEWLVIYGAKLFFFDRVTF